MREREIIEAMETQVLIKVKGFNRRKKCAINKLDFNKYFPDFKIHQNGSISFSSSMTAIIPLSWRYVRFIAFGHIYQNNTASFMVSELDPTTWDNGGNFMVSCPIASTSTTTGAKFYINNE